MSTRGGTRKPSGTSRPGTGKPRRAATRPSRPAARSSSTPASSRKPGTPQAWKLAGVALVVVLLGVFLFPTVKGYVDQRREITRLEQDIQAQRQEIEDLQAGIEQWEDDDYVEQQARERLRFVRPGETAIAVLDDTGELLTEAAPGMAPVTNDVHENRPWYGEVWESVKVVQEGLPETDAPAGPAPEDPATPTDDR